MGTTFTQKGLDAQYSTIGVVFATENEEYKIIEKETLNKLLSNIEILKQSQQMAYYRGNNVNFNSDKLSGAVSAININKVETGEVIVSKRAIEEILQSSTSVEVNNGFIMNLTNQISSLKSQVESLKKENKSLTESPSSTLVKDMQKQLNAVIPKLKDANNEIKKLKEELEKSRSLLHDKDNEIISLKNNMDCGVQSVDLDELENLRTEVARLKEKRSNNTMKAREKALEVRSKNSREIAAFILGCIIRGSSIEETRVIISNHYNKEIKPATIYRAISVREDIDKQRILNLYAEFSENFSGVCKEDIIQWFETTRIKKLHLIPKEEFILKYGNAALPVRDPFITKDYYSEKDM